MDLTPVNVENRVEIARGDPLQWSLYGAKVVAAFAVIVSGMSSHQDTEWTSKYILYVSAYSIWAVMTLTFVGLNLERTTDFVSRALLYVASIILAFWFTFRVLRAEPDAIPTFIPLCIDIGIFLGTALENTWLTSKDVVQKYLSRSCQVIKDLGHTSKLALLNWLAN